MRILFIVGHEFLYNPQNGGQKCSLRNYNLIKKVAGEENVYPCMFSNYEYQHLGENEKVFPTQKNKLELVINTLSGRNVCSRKVWKEMVAYINSLEVDAVFCDSSTIGRILKFVRSDIVKMVFFHNIERNYAKNKVLHDGIAYLIPFFSYVKNEKAAIKYSNYNIFLNERDRKEAGNLYGYTNNFLLPITFEDEFVVREKQEKNSVPVLLFVGSLFSPNYSGIKWFIEEVMPYLPDYMLYVVGKNMEQKREELERFNVKVIGTTDNLTDYYYLADAVVIPIFYGNGMKVKTAEAMMYGKNIFATEEALEGYEFEEVKNKGIYQCDSRLEFIQQIKKNVNRSNQINEAVRKCFVEKYATEAVERKFREFLSEAVCS